MNWLMDHWQLPCAYLAAVNLAAFCMMGVDKHRAIKKQWRIPERSLFLSALLGGSIGAILGMRAFHHKTRHWYFRFGMPAILICQLALAAFLWIRFGAHS